MSNNEQHKPNGVVGVRAPELFMLDPAGGQLLEERKFKPEDIPASYSIEQKDYVPELGRKLVVSLDGVPQKNVLSYDIEAGTITRFQADASGEVAFDEITGCWAVETVSGCVSVAFKPLED